MFNLFLAGAEQPKWRRLLTEAGARSVAISFANLRPRLPKKSTYTIADRFDDRLTILLDSGGFAISQKAWNRDALQAYFDQYAEFVTANIERLDYVTEFDCDVHDVELVQRWRDEFWNDIPRSKFIPIWHPGHGQEELERLAQTYATVGVVTHEQLASKLNLLVARHGVRLHSTHTNVDDMETVRYASAMSSSWTSPMRYGETHVWQGNKLRRFSKKVKDQRRRSATPQITKAGYQPSLVQADDYDEVARFTISQWVSLEERMSRRRSPDHSKEGSNGKVVDINKGREEDEHGGNGKGEVATTPQHPVHNELTTRRERTVMPVMDTEERRSVNPEDGTPMTVTVPKARSSSMRRCDSCSLQHVCPQFQPSSECAFELPVRITTKDQLVAVLTWCLEIQTGRIAMAKLSEDLQGGYLDKNLSDELERMFKMSERLKEIKDDRDILDLRVRARGGSGGLISQFFNPQAGAQARELPHGGLSEAETDRFAADFVEADVVDEDDE